MAIIDVLNEWNPWWFGKKEVLEELAGVERPEYGGIIKTVDMRETTVITGIRRSGKSTIMYQMVKRLIENKTDPKNILLVNFEDQALIDVPLDEIYAEYRQKINPNKKAFLFLDEVQKKEKWELWVRKKYDLKTDAKFVVSGSSARLLKKEYSTLLTGRIVSFEIMPLNFKEFLGFSKISFDKKMAENGLFAEQDKPKIQNALDQYLKEGGFPEVFFKEKEQKRLLLTNYFDDIIFKDIVDRHGIKSQKPKELARHLATNLAGNISLRTLRQATELSYDQIKEYLNYLTEAFLFFETNHFSYSLKEQKTRPSKIYCADNGLRNAVAFKFSEDAGKLAENLVFLELKRRGAETYYWKNKNEVDFVVKNPDNSLDAINVSFTDEINERETAGLQEFKKQNKRTGKLLLITKNLEKTQQEIKYIPLWKWLIMKE
ncbi:MAG: ATP-binding protein [Candidatus ainarchaeum sp.]|nr:ATP-binding protein [Candidatus ainarchaeum sp.]